MTESRFRLEDVQVVRDTTNSLYLLLSYLPDGFNNELEMDYAELSGLGIKREKIGILSKQEIAGAGNVGMAILKLQPEEATKLVGFWKSECRLKGIGQIHVVTAADANALTNDLDAALGVAGKLMFGGQATCRVGRERR